jgi:hypothetical protein
MVSTSTLNIQHLLTTSTTILLGNFFIHQYLVYKNTKLLNIKIYRIAVSKAFIAQ